MIDLVVVVGRVVECNEVVVEVAFAADKTVVVDIVIVAVDIVEWFVVGFVGIVGIVVVAAVDIVTVVVVVEMMAEAVLGNIQVG